MGEVIKCIVCGIFNEVGPRQKRCECGNIISAPYNNMEMCGATKPPTSSRSSGVSGYSASDTQKLEAVRLVVEKHRNAVFEPYLIPGGAREVLKVFFEDISRVVE